MAKNGLGLVGAKVALVPDDTYYRTVTAMVRGARHHCLCGLFIVDPSPLEDEKLLVDGLLQDLASTAWRGVDVRLTIGGSRDNARIRDACLLARARAQDLQVPARLSAAIEQPSDHAKIVITDDLVLLGSHNWSPGALTVQTQDSVLIEDAALAGLFATRFDERWATARAEGFDVPV